MDALKKRGNHDIRVESTTPISWLNLQGSFFPSKGGEFESLVAALKKLKNLEYVNLEDCSIHPTGQEKIRRFLSRINSDMVIVMGEEDDSDEEEETFEDFLQRQL